MPPVRERLDRFADRRRHAALVDLAHGEHANAQLADDAAFARIERARPEQHQSFGPNVALAPAQPRAEAALPKQRPRPACRGRCRSASSRAC